MYKAITLLGPQSPNGPDELVTALGTAALGITTAVAVHRPAALRPGATPPDGGVVVAWLASRDAALEWQRMVAEAAADVPTVVGTEHVIRGADTIYKDGRRAAFGGLKVVAFLEAIGGVTTAAFAEHWHDRHAALAADVIPDHIASYGYVQNHAIGDPPQPYAGVAESYWSGIAALGAWSSWYFGDDGAVLRHDEDIFIDTTTRIIVVASELLIRS